MTSQTKTFHNKTKAENDLRWCYQKCVSLAGLSLSFSYLLDLFIPSKTCSRNKTSPMKPVLSLLASVFPSVRSNSSGSFITVLCQVVFHRPIFLFLVGVHPKATLGTLSLGIFMTRPSHRSQRL